MLHASGWLLNYTCPCAPQPQAKAKLESDLQAGVYDKMDEWVANLKDLGVSAGSGIPA